MNQIKAVGISTSITIVFITIITFIGELLSPFNEAIASLTGHHWVSKGVLAIVLFTALWALLKKSKGSQNAGTIATEVKRVMWTTLTCYAAIFFFFAWHYFSH